MIVYKTATALFFALSKIFFSYKIYGQENIPKRGGLIIASNHASYFDPVFVGIGTHRVLSYMARESLFKNFLFGRLIRLVNTFPVKRDTQDIAAMRHALLRLKAGKALLIFPEGRRSTDGNLQKAKAGISFLTHTAGVPVVPVYVGGSFKVLPKGRSFIKLAPVSVRFGAPLDFNNFCRQNGFVDPQDAYRNFADYVMQAIAGLKKAGRV